PARVVRQQHDGAGRAANQRRDVGASPGPESNADEIDRFPFHHHARARIFQHLDAARRQGVGHVMVVVVIAQDAEDAVSRGERLERVGRRPYVLMIAAAAPCDVVASEDDQIGALVLQWRGLVYEATEELADVLGRERVTGYIGFDPTASSLHIGSLLPMIALARLQRFGHSPIAIAGGGTGMIGDPKPTQERSLLSLEEIARNLEGIKPQLARLLDFDDKTNPARIINNADWLAKFDLLGFLRDT